MNSDGKAGAIVLTWLMVGGIAFFTLPRIAETVSEDWVILGVMGILALIGLGTTFIVAVMTRTEPLTSERQTRERTKPKNSDTALVDRLLATMSDDELASLRRRLSADEQMALDDDGELVPMAQGLDKRR
jgi:hypothetical protein